MLEIFELPCQMIAFFFIDEILIGDDGAAV
jgi:hypothetical protein